MINDFDKEIDSLLRRTARGGASVSNGKSPQMLHIDADEISLFAENALPGKNRLLVMEHLADCDRCRKILSGLILLNSEVESENIHAKEIVSTAVLIPWYKKLFMFPQIAYAMGALALAFSGVIALMVLQTVSESQNNSVAQMERVEEKQQGAKGMSSDGDATTSETYSSMSNTTTTNTTTTSSNSTMANIASATPMSKSDSSMSAANSNAAVPMDEKMALADKDAEPKPPAPTVAASAPNKPAESAKKEDFVADGPAATQRRDNEARDRTGEITALNRQQAELSQNSVAQNQAGIAPDSRNVQRSAPKSVDSLKNVAREEDTDASAKEAKGKTANARKASTTRTAGGKSFNFRDGAWYDSAYSNQQTTNIRRGTDEYKKLDSGLRSIAENISGVVVIAWKSKAYRIQ